MPRIYAGSVPNTTALEKFPVEGEQEMSDVHGDVLRHFERKKLTQADHVSVFSLFQFIYFKLLLVFATTKSKAPVNKVYAQCMPCTSVSVAGKSIEVPSSPEPLW